MSPFGFEGGPAEAKRRRVMSGTTAVKPRGGLHTGGLGTMVLEFLNDEKLEKRLLRIGIENKFCRVYGKREYLQEKDELNRKS